MLGIVLNCSPALGHVYQKKTKFIPDVWHICMLIVLSDVKQTENSTVANGITVIGTS